MHVGLNRGGNNRSNTFAALQVAKAKVARSLEAIELGNEPDRKSDSPTLSLNLNSDLATSVCIALEFASRALDICRGSS